jgi:glutamate-ammonia-ligase adenylyltransferase
MPTLADAINSAPRVCDQARANQVLADLDAAAAAASLPGLTACLAAPTVRSLLQGVASGSPYLTTLMTRDAARLERVLQNDPSERLAAMAADLDVALAKAGSISEVMRDLRRYKTEAALIIGLADLGGVWPVMQVTRRLSQVADCALQGAVRFLFRQAAAKGDWLARDPAAPEQGSGYFVLGMGKYGAFELNYSSDIDLIVFYDLERARLREGVEPATFFVRLTRDLVRLIDERTADGYVFRVDLRLRPDAGATQVALSTEAALIYYESFGQNWERAALIKARSVAGDVEAGDALLADLAPFVWRKYLDFAAIADVHAMKRQINAFRGLSAIGVAGHNVKLGRGGIREIEFFAQTQQLIAGGRQNDLRVRPTLEALQRLVARGWIKEPVRQELQAAYLYLREIEHRIQMVGDEQTHTLPDTGDRLESFARFAGYATLDGFAKELLSVLSTVQRHYAVLFEDMPELTSGGGNMVFAGEDDDPGTIEALRALGYSQPSQILATVRGWHHGRYAAVRSAPSRERLTEVQPLLIAALADTADPDRAFASFDRFLSELPTGIQLFALLRANPGLLRLVADIMGTAPRLARILSRRRRLLDAVLDPRTLGTQASAAELDRIIASELGHAEDVQEKLDRARVIGSEQIFLIGVRVLSGMIDAGQAGEAYALLAERLMGALQAAVEGELGRANGQIAGGAAAVVAMGKLGGHEMTASSDLDLIVIYDFAEGCTASDGARELSPNHYYTRLTQRLIAALSSPTAEGTLYEVDMRLRPSGLQGPVATQLESFISYQETEAWTWEHMALTRARVITGPATLREKVEAAIRTALVRVRDRGRIATDVRDMRERIWKEKKTDNIWDLKQVRGGLVDLEFIAQHLQLVHAAEHPQVLDQNTVVSLVKLRDAGVLEVADATALISAAHLIHSLTQVLRLCLDGPFDPAAAPRGLTELLARAGDAPSFEVLQGDVRRRLAEVAALFDKLIV